MSDFVKIFLFISAVVSAFLFGRGYGERTYRQSSEYKEFAKAKEELGYANNELENAKAKLQNIVDSADTKKTDELLGQILQVFLADLGLRIQNREAILKSAQNYSPPQLNVSPPIPKAEVVAEAVKNEQPAPKNTSQSKFKSSEWMLQNAESERQALRSLKKLELKKMSNVSLELNGSTSECTNFLGTYRGSIIDDSNKRFGSLIFNLREKSLEGAQGYSGTINWYNAENGNPLSQKVENGCGKKITGLEGRIFDLADNRVIQVYKLSNLGKLGGIFYEVLPNGATNRLGSFVLGRTDIFR